MLDVFSRLHPHPHCQNPAQGIGKFPGHNSWLDITSLGTERSVGLTDQERLLGEDRLRRGKEKCAQQLMLDAEAINGEGGLMGLTLEALIERANQALKSMTGTEGQAGRPEKVEFISMVVQRKGGILLELGMKEEREWLVHPDICASFTENFGGAVKYRARKYPVLVKCIPIGINIGLKTTLEEIKTSNRLEKDSIVGAKWICNPSRGETDQCHTHLIVYCKSKEDANDWICNTHYIEGKSVASTKLLPVLMRCYNCQLDGHLAKQCIMTVTCSTCSGAHRTDTCTNRRNPYCVPCKMKGHLTWSSACPNYVTRCANLSDCPPDNCYKYYVTSQEWTWQLLSNDSNRRRFRAPQPRNPSQTATGAYATPVQHNLAHPRLENLARPTTGGMTIPPRQTQLSSWLNPTSGPQPPIAPMTISSASTSPLNSQPASWASTHV
jgi:hypothetical protein